MTPIFKHCCGKHEALLKPFLRFIESNLIDLWHNEPFSNINEIRGLRQLCSFFWNEVKRFLSLEYVLFLTP